MTINRNALKTYAPKARREFIAAVTARAAKLGITKSKTAPVQEQGDLVIIGADAYPKRVGEQRQKLINRIALHGFDQAMEEIAYTWFNRLLAIRFMELHGYLDHGYRVLSHPSGNALPEILEHAEHVEFPGLDKSKIIDLKLDGTKDAELYRLLLIAQCNALHRAMPFLFEKIDDETELLLPDNLLHSDSLIRKLVTCDRRSRLAGNRDRRLALPVLHLGEERPGHRQSREVRGHPGRDPALHAQLDRQIHGPELARRAVAGHISR